jgi:hypothetical protein
MLVRQGSNIEPAPVSTRASCIGGPRRETFFCLSWMEDTATESNENTSNEPRVMNGGLAADPEELQGTWT